MRESLGRHVDSDDGKVAVLKLKDVRAIHERGRLRAVGVRVGAESAEEHGHSVRVKSTHSEAEKPLVSMGEFHP